MASYYINEALRERSKNFLKNAADIASLLEQAREEIMRLRRQNEALRRQLEGKRIGEGVDFTALGLARSCASRPMKIYRTAYGMYRAAPLGKTPLKSWTLMGQAPQGATPEKIREIVNAGNAANPRTVEVSIIDQSAVVDGRQGKIVPKGDPFDMAVGIIDALDEKPKDVYRLHTGSFRVVPADMPVKGEFVGRFDEGIDLESVQEAIA